MKDDIEFSNFKNLLPNTHLSGLELLVNKEVFLDAHDEVVQEKRMMEEKKEEDAKKRLAGKKRREEKAEADAKQPRVDQLFKSKMQKQMNKQ